MKSFKDIFDAIIQDVREHPDATVLCADGMGPNLTEDLIESLGPELVSQIQEGHRPSIGWVVFWMVGDLEHSREYSVPVTKVTDALEASDFPPLMKEMVRATFSTAAGRQSLVQNLVASGKAAA